MARGTVNKVILVGRLGADPEVRYTASGTAVVQLSIATNEAVPVGEGNFEERTEWHRVVAFGRTAENCGNYLSKGRLVYVEGRLQTRQWEDAQGAKRYTTEIVAREVQFLGGAGEQPPDQDYTKGESGTRSQSGSPANDNLPSVEDATEEEIPF